MVGIKDWWLMADVFTSKVCWYASYLWWMPQKFKQIKANKKENLQKCILNATNIFSSNFPIKHVKVLEEKQLGVVHFHPLHKVVLTFVIIFK